MCHLPLKTPGANKDVSLVISKFHDYISKELLPLFFPAHFQ